MHAQVSGIQVDQVLRSTIALTNGVRPIRIRHKLKGLIVLHQLIDQHLGIGIVDIVVSGAMDVEEVTFQIFGVGEG